MPRSGASDPGGRGDLPNVECIAGSACKPVSKNGPSLNYNETTASAGNSCQLDTSQEIPFQEFFSCEGSCPPSRDLVAMSAYVIDRAG